MLELTDEALALWVRAGSYCAGHLTDGLVKPSTLRILAADHNAATELVLAGLWEYEDGSWKFHDWAHYQPTKEKVLAEREAARLRVEKHRAKQGGNAVTHGVSNTAPSRPVPTRPQTDFVSPSGDDGRLIQMSRSVLSGLGVDPDRLMAHIMQKTGREVDACGAQRIAVSILERGNDVKNPQAFVLGSITRSAAEVREQIDAERPTPTPRRDTYCDQHPGYPLPCHKCAAIAAEQETP